MVFNFPVLADPYPPSGRTVVATGGRLTRRSALAGFVATGAAMAVAGCTPKQTTSAADLISGDALGPLYTETTQLIAQYDRALTAAPVLVALLGPLREEHRQHLIALASLIGLATPAVSPGPNPTGLPLAPPHPSGAVSPGTTPTATTPSPTQSSGASGASGVSGASGAAPPPPTGSAGGSGTPATSVLPPASVVPSASPTALSPVAVKARLSAAEKTAQSNAVAACIAVAADRVPIIAAIAACRATHVAALR
jgi:hypothetical protein